MSRCPAARAAIGTQVRHLRRRCPGLISSAVVAAPPPPPPPPASSSVRLDAANESPPSPTARRVPAASCERRTRARDLRRVCAAAVGRPRPPRPHEGAAVGAAAARLRRALRSRSHGTEEHAESAAAAAGTPSPPAPPPPAGRRPRTSWPAFTVRSPETNPPGPPVAGARLPTRRWRTSARSLRRSLAGVGTHARRGRRAATRGLRLSSRSRRSSSSSGGVSVALRWRSRRRPRTARCPRS